nr:M48 family metalloprotease [Nitrosomonas nitrosa]
MGKRGVAGTFVVLFSIMGCGPKVTPIGPGFVYEPDEREQRLWASSQEQSEGLQSGGAFYSSPQLEAYLQAVLERVLGNNLQAYVPLTPKVRVVDSPSPNAFSLCHGDLYLHTGILGRLRNEAQLSMLLGHEIAHSTHRHMYQRTEQIYASTGTNSYIAVLSAIGGGNVRSVASQVSQIITIAAISGYSRDKEEEADQVGLTLMAQAGYDPREGAKMFEAMARAADNDARDVSFLYATHPKMESRVKSCKKLVTRLPPELLANATEIGEEPYVTAAVDLILDEVERHIAQGKYELAIETLVFLKGTRPKDDRALVLLGDLYRARSEPEDVERCRQAYEEALQINDACADAQKGLGFLYVREQDNARATKHLQSYLDLTPNAPDVPYVRQYLLRLQGKGSKGE